MDWFEIWYQDAVSMINTMQANMVADLEAGYNPNGNNIRKQKADLEERQKMFNQQMSFFKLMDRNKVNNWCYYDLLMRGVIQ